MRFSNPRWWGMLVFAAVVLASAGSASATTFWTLTDVTFQDGGTASGSFVLNTAGTAITSFFIQESAAGIFPARTFDSTAGASALLNLSPPGGPSYSFALPGFTAFIKLGTPVVLPDTGGTVNLVIGNATNASGSSDQRTFTGGELIGTVPEPSLVFFAPAVLLGFVAARRRLIRSH